MVKTLQPGEGDDFSIEAEIEAFRSMLDAFDDRGFRASKPLGRLILEKEVFGKEVSLSPFDLPIPYPSYRDSHSNN